jgi:7-keto-8-aminopelargonate synthetase-like enzyme
MWASTFRLVDKSLFVIRLCVTDILMGTFTKSFSGMGGYVAGSKELINFIKVNSAVPLP